MHRKGKTSLFPGFFCALLIFFSFFWRMNGLNAIYLNRETLKARSKVDVPPPSAPVVFATGSPQEKA
jgi:hypothetical protein